MVNGAEILVVARYVSMFLILVKNNVIMCKFLGAPTADFGPQHSNGFSAWSKQAAETSWCGVRRTSE
jgi:hypothetical protein